MGQGILRLLCLSFAVLLGLVEGAGAVRYRDNPAGAAWMNLLLD